MNPIKVLVFGSTGMLGHMVMKLLTANKQFAVCGTHLLAPEDKYYFDVKQGLEKLDSIREANNDFDFFTNCIGITANKINVSDSESVIRAMEINAIFPHQLAAYARNKKSRVIHISTDGVFSGSSECYDEDCPHDCLDLYGKTKSIGEVHSDNFLNIRCSIIGPSPFEKAGLFEWFQSQQAGSVISGYTNHLWSGVTTLQFAELCVKIMEAGRFDVLREESAAFHFSPNCPVSKYELLTILKDCLGKDIAINSVSHGQNLVRRILVSKYSGLKTLYKNNVPIEDAIRQLIGFCK